VSIALIEKPIEVMNPLSYGKDGSTNLVFRFLFRGLIQYDPKSASFVSDLANCDLTNIRQIECTLKANMQWSDGRDIQDVDVIATFEAFRKNAVNPKMQNFISDVSVSIQK
jgi:ABC-type transport system substrate-binding protein